MNCTHCKQDLDGGDIFFTLKTASPNEDPVNLIQYAYRLGWTTQNKRRFNKVVIIKYIEKPPQLLCPFCKGINPLTDDSVSITVENR